MLCLSKQSFLTVAEYSGDQLHQILIGKHIVLLESEQVLKIEIFNHLANILGYQLWARPCAMRRSYKGKEDRHEPALTMCTI